MSLNDTAFWDPIMDFHAVQFLTSATRLEQCPPDTGVEVAFVGRSNAGKSSAINALLGKKLARTSKTPGHTQLMNFFAFDDERRLVDLPGYGYAKVPERIRQQIEVILQSYIGGRHCLKGLFLLMDIRHPLNPADEQLLALTHDFGLPVHILLTKCDKLKRGQAQNTLLRLRKMIAAYPQVTAQNFSALKLIGLEEAQQKLDLWLSENTP